MLRLVLQYDNLRVMVREPAPDRMVGTILVPITAYTGMRVLDKKITVPHFALSHILLFTLLVPLKLSGDARH